jgi:pilus assembly protein Flp/PilA
MSQVMRALCDFLRREDGPTSVEYAVLVALILMTCIVTIKAVGDKTSGIWADNQSKLNAAGF